MIILHILLWILKFIGILLLIVLGLVLLILAIALFVPIRYSAECSIEDGLDSLKAEAHVTFLMKLIRIIAAFEDQELKYSVKIAWLTILSSDSSDEEEMDPDEEEFETESWPAVNPDQTAQIRSETRTTPKSESSPEEKAEHAAVHQSLNKEATQTPHIEESVKEETPFSDRIDRIVDSYQKLYDKIEKLLAKKDLLVRFFENETHQYAFKKALNAVLYLLKKWTPKSLDGEVSFGFEDPAITGLLYGLGCVLHTIFDDHLICHPYFEDQILKGRLRLCGRLKLYPLAKALIGLVLSKKVRITFKRLLRLKNKLL